MTSYAVMSITRNADDTWSERIYFKSQKKANCEIWLEKNGVVNGNNPEPKFWYDGHFVDIYTIQE